jgi:hypothetical protein
MRKEKTMTTPPTQRTVAWENPDGSTNVDGFLKAFAEDENIFWRIPSGHALNVIEELIERSTAERTISDGLRKELETCRELSDLRLEGESKYRKEAYELRQELKESALNLQRSQEHKNKVIEDLRKEVEDLKQSNMILFDQLTDEKNKTLQYDEVRKLRQQLKEKDKELKESRMMLGARKGLSEVFIKTRDENEILQSKLSLAISGLEKIVKFKLQYTDDKPMQDIAKQLLTALKGDGK